MDNSPCIFWNFGRQRFEFKDSSPSLCQILPNLLAHTVLGCHCHFISSPATNRILLFFPKPSLDCIVLHCGHLLILCVVHCCCCCCSPVQFFCIEFHQQHMDWVSTWWAQRPPSDLIIASPPNSTFLSLAFSSFSHFLFSWISPLSHSPFSIVLEHCTLYIKTSFLLFIFLLPFMLCRLMCLIDKDPLDQPRPFRPCLHDLLLHFPLTFALIHLHLMHFLDFHLLSLLLLFLPCIAANSLWVCLPTGPSPPSIWDFESTPSPMISHIARPWLAVS